MGKTGSPQSVVDMAPILLQGWSRQTSSNGLPCLITGALLLFGIHNTLSKAEKRPPSKASLVNDAYSSTLSKPPHL